MELGIESLKKAKDCDPEDIVRVISEKRKRFLSGEMSNALERVEHRIEINEERHARLLDLKNKILAM